jgi:predicted RNase H-like nuclease (RuvC/YqgF family)
MEWEKIAEKIRDLVLGEIKEEFRDFKASVTGELSGFRLAIEALSARQTNLEHELREIKRTIVETNKRIDELRVELRTEIMANTARIDGTNKRIDELRVELKAEIMLNTTRIDTLFLETAGMRSDLKKAISDKEILHDTVFRVTRLETKVAVV